MCIAGNSKIRAINGATPSRDMTIRPMRTFVKFSLTRPAGNQDVWKQACNQQRRQSRSGQQIGKRRIQRPVRCQAHEVEVDDDRKREAGPLDQHEGERSPPGQACGAKAMRRKFRQIEHNGLFHASSSGVPFGQNHPIRAIDTGIDPQTTAHGVKIDQISSTVVASADQSGQIEFPGVDSRASGIASTTPVTISSRRSTDRPAATESVSGSLDSGSRQPTTGKRAEIVRWRW